MKKNKNNSVEISSAIDMKGLGKEKKILEKLMAKEPDNYWAITNYAIIHYELKNYNEAFLYSKKAIKIAKKDSLVLNYHAVILKANNKIKDAIEIWELLLKKNIMQIAFEDCTEGLKWAKSLLNDIRFNLSLTYYELKNTIQARKFMSEHINNRRQGQFSNYSKKEALSRLKKIDSGESRI